MTNKNSKSAPNNQNKRQDAIRQKKLSSNKAKKSKAGAQRLIKKKSSPATRKTTAAKRKRTVHANTSTIAPALLSNNLPQTFSAVKFEIHTVEELKVLLPTIKNDNIVFILTQHKITTLADIRQQGGVPKLEKPTAEEKQALQHLEAHAYLELVSQDLEINQKLIEQGFVSSLDIAKLAKTEFMKKTAAAGIEEKESLAIYNISAAQAAVLTNVYTGLKVEKANHFATLDNTLAETLDLEIPCECRDCESAVSPLAYLVDLLNYVKNNIQLNQTPLEIDQLEELFFQPISNLIPSCEQVNIRIRQVRIAIEVLRRHLNKKKMNSIEISSYLFEAYQRLLKNIGSSYDEIRRIRTEPQEKRQALAERLGIVLSDARPDELDQLFLPPEALSESWLEECFGLPDTGQDALLSPLSHGLKIGDENSRIQQWTFMGVRWNKNTHQEGMIFIDLEYTADHKYVFRVYRDEGKEELLAESNEFSGTSGKILLHERNQSQLTGELIVQLEPGAFSCHISLMPRLACWRLKHLRSMWQHADHPEDDYTSHQLAVIDPDIIGPDDIRQPETVSQLHFGLWQHRRQWLDSLWQELRGDLGQPMNIDAALANMYQPLAYSVFQTTSNMPEQYLSQPWLNTTPLESFDTLYLQLTKGTSDEINMVKERVLNDLRLNSDAFMRLMGIKNNTNPPDHETALEFTAILLNAKKRSHVDHWIEEEAAIPGGPIVLSPRHFITSLSQPQVKEFSPALYLIRPLIDPDKISDSAILNSEISAAARQIWQSRKDILEATEAQLKAAYNSGGLEALLQASLGPLPLGQVIPGTWTEYLTQLNEQLKSFDSVIRKEAENLIHQHFFMETNDFNQIIRTKQKLDNANQLTPEDLKTLCVLFTSSYKQRLLVVSWTTEEDAGSFPYWKVLKHCLPKWRATMEGRLTWHNRLIKNSSAPAVDPDLIFANDLLQPHSTNPAFPLLNSRRNDMMHQLQSIRHVFMPRTSFCWGEAGSEANHFQSPRGVVVDEKRGYVYVADRGNCRISKFDLFGHFIKFWGTRGRQPGQFLFPEYLAIDRQGYIFVSDNSNHRIQKFDCDGNFILQWGQESPDNDPVNGTFKNPGGLAVNHAGMVFVADRNNHRIQIFNHQGEFIHAFGSQGSGQYEFNLPVAVSLGHEGNLYVADNENHRIQVFNADYQFYKTIGSEGSGPGRFRRPQGIAIDHENNLYITDDYNRVQKLNSEGELIDAWGGIGSGDLEFQSPRGLAVDQHGNIYVADSLNHRIQIIVRDGIFSFHLAVQQIIGIPLTALKQTALIRDELNDFPNMLKQWNLTYESFDFLIKMLALAKSAVGVLPTEWEQVQHILLNVVKERAFFGWHKAEHEQSVLLSPDFFVLSEEEPDTLIPYRASWQDRRAWQDKLKNRFTQVDSVLAGLTESVDDCEEHALTLLRDKCIESFTLDGGSISEKANQLTRRLLLDFQTAACQKTTRVSQVLSTLQSLFFSLRNGNLPLDNLSFLPNDYFKTEWRWIGSYETWKSALGVFLYPENILLPAFRNQSSPMFADLLRKMQSNHRFTISDANEMVGAYTDYFNDIRCLTVEASCHFRVWPLELEKYSLMMFARGGATGRAYWSFCENNIGHHPNPSYWSNIPPFHDVIVDKIIGAVPFQPNQDESYIYVFAKIKDHASRQIAFAKFDVKHMTWLQELTTYEPDISSVGYEAVVLNTNNDRTTPRLFLTSQEEVRSKIYWTALNASGNDFEELILFEDRNDRISCQGACQFGYSNQNICMLFMKSAQFGYYMVPFSFDNILSSPRGEQILLYTLPILDDAIADPTDHPLIRLDNYAFRSYLADRDELKGFSFFFNKEMVYVFWKQQNTFQYQAFEIILHEHANSVAFETLEVNQPLRLNRSCHLRPLFEPAELAGFDHQDQIVPHSYLGTLFRQRKFERLAGKTGNFWGYLRSEFYVELDYHLILSQQERVTPLFGDAYEINNTVGLAQTSLQQKAFLNNLEGPALLLEYLKEAFYYLPLSFALQLQQNHEYQEALAWYRTIYNYEAEEGERKIYYGLILEENIEGGFVRPEEWLRDPLNCHGIASNRRNTYSRNILVFIIQCLLDYADAEFSYDTVESLPRARMLYETAEMLLKSEVFNYGQNDCDQLIGDLALKLDQNITATESDTLIRRLKQVNSPAALKAAIEIIDASEDMNQIMPAITDLVDAHLANQPTSIRDLLTVPRPDLFPLYRTLCQTRHLNKGLGELELFPNTYLPFFNVFHGASYSFCVPKNPLIDLLGIHAEINLFKLRNCRNIAGMKRELADYAAPIDILSAMPSLSPGGTMNLATRIAPLPLPYRYDFLLTRTKEFVNLAQQLEQAMLAALEKYEQEKYNLLKARQDAELARAGVKLQNLRLKKANDEVTLALAQLESANIQETTYQAWLAQGINDWEQKLLKAYIDALLYRRLIAGAEAAKEVGMALTTAATASVGSVAAFANAAIVATMSSLQAPLIQQKLAAETSAQIASFYASYERRAQEWELQLQLAANAKVIGKQQVKISEDNVKIVEQEKKISEIQAEQVEEIIEFLKNKETNAELYSWMLNVLESVYSYFLQQATATARMAQSQLAFERQEAAPSFIQNDYWVVSPDNLTSNSANASDVDRHGLTGSARLLADLYKLDQYKFETEKRKLQLSKTISLATLAPYEFQKFRETGVITFGTPMEIFDRDFPGHYLRMIKQVRTSVVALIPPTQGIKATLSSVGVSNLITKNNGLFQTITAYRSPESVALTSPMNATGVFELEAVSDMLLPFENMGVDTLWEFKMPCAANHFDFKTIADVLITIDYTALFSSDYSQMVIDALPKTLTSDRAFSFRHQFADQWFDLHNPDQSADPMCVTFKTRLEDFPPNLTNLKIQHVLLYLSGQQENLPEFSVELTFLPDDPAAPAEVGGEAQYVDKLISTRHGNGAAWLVFQCKVPAGTWTLRFPNTFAVKQLFSDSKIEDILLVVTYGGIGPEWPK